MDIVLGSGDQTHVLTRDGSSNTILDFRSIHFTASMSGGQETSPNGSTATGAGAGVLNFAQESFVFGLDITGIDLDGHQTADKGDNMLGFHIHKAAAGVNGPVIFEIPGDADTVIVAATGRADGSWDAGDGLGGVNLDALLADGLYFNIHTGDFPGGEIRGQILQQDEGNDIIDLRGLNIGSLAQLRAITKDDGGNAVISSFFNGVQSQLVLDGVSEDDFGKDFFQFARKANTVHGTDNQDDLFASARGSHVFGFDGNDRLFGGNGDDALTGGFGNDRMTGGKGQDILDGTGGKDRYVFKSVADSSASAETADQIGHFVSGFDKLDLAGVDGKAGTAGNQALVYIGFGPFTAEGQVRQFIDGDYSFIEVNTSGAGGADMMIRVVGAGILETDIIL